MFCWVRRLYWDLIMDYEEENFPKWGACILWTEYL